MGAVLSLGATGCMNLFGGIDHPGGDAQLTSAARACLDAGDYKCALDDYAQLSAAYSDIQNSESAYSTYGEYGASMQAFAGGFGNGKNANIGTGLTAMADSILAAGYAGTTARLALYNAFIKYQSITDNTALSGLVEFLGATAFASEVLAEMAETAGQTTMACSQVSTSNAIGTCAGGLGGPLGTCLGSSSECPTSTASNYTSSNIQSANSGNATLDMFNAAVLSIDDGINRIGGSGSFASSFTTVFTTLGLNTASCSGQTNTLYIGALQTIGVGGC